MQGFDEDRAEYLPPTGTDLVGQYRRLSSAGPAYQIMQVDADGTVHIELVYNDQKLTYPLAEILEDPIAETIP